MAHGAISYLRARGRAPGGRGFVAEAWGTDAVSPLAYLAAKTERLLAEWHYADSARTPVTTAQTALTLATCQAIGLFSASAVRGRRWSS